MPRWRERAIAARADTARARYGVALCAGSLCLGALGCVPTLSAPHSERFLDAMAEASRDHAHGRDEEAAEAWARAASAADRRVDRDEAEVREAQALRRAGRNDEALALFDAVGARTPTSRRTARARLEAARLRLARGEREAGLEGLRAICRTLPGEGVAGRALARLLTELRPQGDASVLAELTALEPAARGTELMDDLLTARAVVHEARGERDAARRALEAIVADASYPRAPRWDDTLWRLADLAEADGDPRAAIAYLERLVAPHSEGIAPGSYTPPRMPEAALRLARLYRDALRDLDAADAAFGRAHDEFAWATVRDDALLERASLRISRGQTDAACGDLRQLLTETEVGAARRAAEALAASRCGDR